MTEKFRDSRGNSVDIENNPHHQRKLSLEGLHMDGLDSKRHSISKQIEHADNVSLHGSLGEQVNEVPEFTPEEARRTLRKIDVRLVPFLAFLYVISFVDRGNIGNAKVAGMVDDLGLKGLEYNTALTLFFIPYALLEVPSNIVLKILRPSLWITLLMFCWGLVMTLMGIVQNYHGLIAARFCLGIAESGFFPAATFLLTLWYLRYEVQSRMVVFYAGASLSGAFSGLLAYGIQHMDGVAGLEGWRWIFILEGIFTVVMSTTVWYVLPDSPLACRFLTPLEKEWIVGRLQTETGSGRGRVTNEDRISFQHVKNALKEWRIWATVPVFWGNSIGVYGFTYTVPTVIKQLGYSAANAQLLTIPIYVFAMIITTAASFYSDRVKKRTPVIIAGFAAAALGFIALISIPHPAYPGLTYGFLFLAAAGMYTPLCPIVCWVANNLAPSSKRAVGMALLISAGNLGGIAGSNIYIAKEEPHYWAGYGFSLAIMVVAIIMTLILRVVLSRENARRDAMTADEINAKYTDDDLLALGDRSPYYRYTN